ncbi:NRDE family protein [Psychromonas ossibalaenae]|uniref:NRDE family protein n=1 Tax=Psychromonas ossibalaenae TaxID=444922 RepID=UPI000371C6EC|nr:NRDE family protein [Psychromonas ossibalaenae]
MCTLTYLLTDQGYELFFNRDEQRTRQCALPPAIDAQLSAVYPVDPVGQGTWLAVHNSGMSLALLNFYQAQAQSSQGPFLSRGEIILSLLKDADNAIEVLKKMDLSAYLAFQLCIFAKDLCSTKNRIRTFQWTGKKLIEVENTLPITSSSVEYPTVYKARKARYLQIVDAQKPTTKQFLAYHRSQETEGKLSVRMSRDDAKTVSMSHIRVAQSINFDYFDFIKNTNCQVFSERLRG